MLEDAAFQAKLEKADGVEAYKAIFAAEGIDFDAEFADDGSDVELSAEDQKDVAGGLSASDLIRIVKNSYKVVMGGPMSWAKWGGTCGILIRAYMDISIYGSATHTYSASTIEKAAQTIGCL